MRIYSGVSDQYINFVAVDATDLKTRETALSSFTVYRSRNGGTGTAYTSPEITAIDNTNMPGVYKFLLDEDMTLAADNLTEEIVLHITHASMAPVTRTIELVNPAVDGLIAWGQAQSIPNATSIKLAATVSIPDSALIGATVHIYDSTNGKKQSRVITAWNNTTKDATVDTWNETPTGTITYFVYATAPSSAADPVTVDVTHWNGSAVATPTNAGVPEVDITHVLGTAADTTTAHLGVNVVNAGGTAWGSGAITAASIAADAITAAKVADGTIDAATFAAGAINAAAIADGAIDAATFAAGAIDAAAIANAAIDAATFAADVDAEILSYIVDDATRIDASALNTASGTSIPAILADTGTDGVVVAAASRAGIRKNTALAAFEILMTDSTNHAPATGLTVTVTRSIDGGAFGAGTLGAVTELSNGIYKFDFAAGDLNGDVITLRATAAGADDLFVTIKTSP